MVVVFKKGEDFFPKFKEFLKRNRVNSGFFYGLGGFQKAEIAFYDMAKKRFLKKKVLGPFEVLSLIGNVSQADDEIFIHAHVSLGKKDFSVIGGHLIGGTVKATLELKLSDTEILERKTDEDTGLQLLS